jgi:hypothetical protein
VGRDEVFRDLVLARIIEPTSKQDSLRVLAETGIAPVDYRTVTRRLPVIAKPKVRQALSAARAARAGLGPASLVLYDVSTLLCVGITRWTRRTTPATRAQPRRVRRWPWPARAATVVGRSRAGDA